MNVNSVINIYNTGLLLKVNCGFEIKPLFILVAEGQVSGRNALGKSFD